MKPAAVPCPCDSRDFQPVCCVLSRTPLINTHNSVTRTPPLCINSSLMYHSTSSSGRKIMGGACSLQIWAPWSFFCANTFPSQPLTFTVNSSVSPAIPALNSMEPTQKHQETDKSIEKWSEADYFHTEQPFACFFNLPVYSDGCQVPTNYSSAAALCRLHRVVLIKLISKLFGAMCLSCSVLGSWCGANISSVSDCVPVPCHIPAISCLQLVLSPQHCKSLRSFLWGFQTPLRGMVSFFFLQWIIGVCAYLFMTVLIM